MQERIYKSSPSTGQPIGQGGTFDIYTGVSRAMAPADMPAPDAHVSTDQIYPHWDPNSPPTDPHKDDYETGDGPPSTGPVPSNIIAGDGSIGDVDADFSDGDDSDDGDCPAD